MIEMIYHCSSTCRAGPEVHFMGLTLNQSAMSWIGAIVLLGIGFALFESRGGASCACGARCRTEIAQEIKRCT
jgi:hypothetical protein